MLTKSVYLLSNCFYNIQREYLHMVQYGLDFLLCYSVDNMSNTLRVSIKCLCTSIRILSDPLYHIKQYVLVGILCGDWMFSGRPLQVLEEKCVYWKLCPNVQPKVWLFIYFLIYRSRYFPLVPWTVIALGALKIRWRHSRIRRPVSSCLWETSPISWETVPLLCRSQHGFKTKSLIWRRSLHYTESLCPVCSTPLLCIG